MSWYLDTNICINCLRGTTPLVKQVLLGLEPSRIKVPAMAKAELLLGAAKSNKPRQNQELVELFLSPFEIVPFDDKAAMFYGQIRSKLEKEGQIIGFNDLIIASTVMAHEGILVTDNLREFGRVSGLKLENWTEVDWIEVSWKK